MRQLDSLYLYVSKDVRSYLLLSFFMGGKKNFMIVSIKLSHVVTSPCLREFAHLLALSCNVEGKGAKHISSYEISGILNEAHIE